MTSQARSPLRKVDPRWTAVVERDARADGSFFYAVSTTGIYCNPSCAARLPRAENVVFYATQAEAAAAGYRPCKRCLPELPPKATRDTAQVASLCRLIESQEPEPSLDELAQSLGASASHTHRLFKRVTGITPKQYAAECRRQRAREALPGSRTVTAAIYTAGYGSPARFYEAAQGSLGMPPRAYRAGAPGEVIRFAIAQTSLGALLVAATERGLCAILLDDDPEALLDDLSQRFRHATLVGAQPDFDALVAKVVGLVERPGQSVELPLDIRGTAFQQRVWSALTKIPPGQTLSYADLAARIGSPTGARAVASACAKNPLAVAVPCHRVVRRDGGLSGYRWGVERKRQLLERESQG